MEKNQSSGANENNQGKDSNAGGAGFNQGSEQDPNFDKGAEAAEKDKIDKLPPIPQKRQDEFEKNGQTGRKNSGGFQLEDDNEHQENK